VSIGLAQFRTPSHTIYLGGFGYDAFRYPAGEVQVRLTKETIAAVESATRLVVIARITCAEHIMELANLRSALRDVKPDNETVLVMPYLPYARADRRFVKGDCFGLEVFGQLVAAMGFDRVVTLDAHSPKALSCVPKLIDVSPRQLIEMSIFSFAESYGVPRVNVLFPDEGARKRYHIPEFVGYNTRVVAVDKFFASKHRDSKTGALSGFSVPMMPAVPTIVVDDLCDGGGTFLGIADMLRTTQTQPLGLYVTHGIFSKGLAILFDSFEHIYASDSYQAKYDDPTSGRLHVFDSIMVLKAAL